jgi:hypothetical protein
LFKLFDVIGERRPDKLSQIEGHQEVLEFWIEIDLDLLRFPWISVGIDSFPTK